MADARPQVAGPTCPPRATPRRGRWSPASRPRPAPGSSQARPSRSRRGMNQKRHSAAASRSPASVSPWLPPSRPIAAAKVGVLGLPAGRATQFMLRLAPPPRRLLGEAQEVGRVRAAAPSSSSPRSRRRSSANSRTVSSIAKRGVVRAGRRPSRRTRLWSTSAPSRSSTSTGSPPGDRLRGLQREAADEDGQAPEERLLLRGEQVVAPGDRVAQGALAGRGVARPAGQQRQRAAPGGASSAGGGSTRTRAAASSIASGRPSRRRQISATAAAFVGGQRRSRGRRRGRGRRTGATASDLGHGRVGGSGSPRQAAPAAGRAAACSPREAQRRPAGGEDLQRRAGGQQVGDSRRGRQDLLAVVEDEQQPAGPAGTRPAPRPAGGRPVSRTPSAWAIGGERRGRGRGSGPGRRRPTPSAKRAGDRRGRPRGRAGSCRRRPDRSGSGGGPRRRAAAPQRHRSRARGRRRA